MEIDTHIKPLVDEFNKIEGIETKGSCEGHTEDDDTYIVFEVKDLLSLTAIGNRISMIHTELCYRVPKNTTFSGGVEYHTQFKNGKTHPYFRFYFTTNNFKWRHQCIAFFIKRFKEIREKHGTEAKNIELGEEKLIKKLMREKERNELRELEKIKAIKIIDEQTIHINSDFLKKVNEYGKASTEKTYEDKLLQAVFLTLQDYKMDKTDLLNYAYRLSNAMMGKRPSPHKEE